MSAMNVLRVVNSMNVRNVALAIRGRRLLTPLSSMMVGQQKANYFIKNGQIHRYKSEFWMPAVDETKSIQHMVLDLPIKIAIGIFILFACLTWDIYTMIPL